MAKSYDCSCKEKSSSSSSAGEDLLLLAITGGLAAPLILSKK